MSYQVLARKYRPRNFETLSGQEHVVRVLKNALENQRLHHAYLFTGTRGVGKTTIARILAKCLNCEQGITAKPCGTCSACQEIDQGRFIDLIEVDAASRTKVEDTRELLNNVQYSPTRGRFKIYLIDEVHMLSGHSFNALLKTLEEPPEHVKFLLATTDPQKLPITVLSRCLQFHLKNLPTEKISHYLKIILPEEKINFEEIAISQIAKAANGSMRDALSLLDQAISFGHGEIKTQDVNEMLGTIQHSHIHEILQALAAQDGKTLIQITAQLAEKTADFASVLEELITSLHTIAILQTIPDAPVENASTFKDFSKLFSPQDIQLFYQIALMGRKDLSLAPNPIHGFEMILLRLLAFQPASELTTPKNISIISKAATAPTMDNSNSDWINLLTKLNINGMTHALAANCTLKSFENNRMELSLHPTHATLLNEKLKNRLNQAMDQHFNQPITLTITVEKNAGETPAQHHKNVMDKRHQAAIQDIQEDPTVKAFMNKLDATIEPELVKPLDD